MSVSPIPQNLLKHHSQALLAGLSLPPAPAMQGDLRLALVMGGTSIRCLLVGEAVRNAPEDQTKLSIEDQPKLSISWEDLQPLAKSCDKPLSEIGDEAVEMLAHVAVSLISRNGAKASQICRVGFSVPGRVSESPDGVLLTTSNTKVTFSNYRIADAFAAAFSRQLNAAIQEGSIDFDAPPPIAGGFLEQASFNPKSPAFCVPPQAITLLNDGYASALGEVYHERGALRGVERGISIIVGTGLGGGDIERMPDGAYRVSARVWEPGYSFVLVHDPVNPRFCFQDQQNLKAYGALQDNEFRKLTYRIDGFPISYAQERLGGPWVAARAIKSLGQEESMLNALLELAQAKSIPVTQQALDVLGEIARNSRFQWGRELKDSVVDPVNKLITAITWGDHLWAGNHLSGKSARHAMVINKLFQFKSSVINELGLFIKALRRQYFGQAQEPATHRIVLGSGIIKGLAQDPAFLDALTKVSHSGKNGGTMLRISELPGDVREAYGVTGPF